MIEADMYMMNGYKEIMSAIQCLEGPAKTSHKDEAGRPRRDG